MSTAKRIAKNTLMMLSSNLAQKGLSFFLIIYLARFLSLNDFGIYSFIFSFAAMFSVIADAGLTNYLAREITKNKDYGWLLGGSAIIKILLSVISIALLFFAIILMKYDSFVIRMVMVAGISMVLDSMAGLFRSVFFATERMGFELVVNLFQKGFILVASIYVLFSGFGIYELVLVMLIASALSLILSIGIVLFLFEKPKIDFSPGFYKTLFFSALPFCFIGLLMSLYSNMDLTMISFFHKGNLEFVAYYSAATRLINSLSLISISFSSAIFPVMTNFFARGNKSLSFIIEKSLKYLLIIILPIAFAIMIVAEPILDLFFPGGKFGPGANALRILIWFCAISFINIVFMSTLNSINKEKKSARFVAVALFANVAMNFFLIPQFNFIGASVATVLSSLLHLSLNYKEVSKTVKGISFIRPAAKPLAASALMALFVFFIRQMSILFIIPLAAIFYFAVLYFMKGIAEEDKQLLFRIFAAKQKTVPEFSRETD